MESSQDAPALRMYGSRNLPAWLEEQGVSLAFSAMRVGKLFLLGLDEQKRLALFDRTFARCAALHADADSLLLGSAFQVWRLHNVVPQGADHEGHDRLYVPMVAWTTGDIDLHDIAVDANGRVLVVSTLFSCIATLGDRHSFHPVWQPPFVSALAPEDRCHLNGFALRDGVVTHASVFAASDVVDGWRERRLDGGRLLRVPDGETVVEGLCMPHTPRWYDGRLWMLESGSGRFGYVDTERGVFEPVTFCPGFARGLDFVGRHAVIGLSHPRGEQTFEGLPIAAELESRGASPRCGVLIVNLDSGETLHWLRLEGVVQELHAVVALPGTRRVAALGLLGEGIHRTISVGPPAPL